MSSPAKTKGLLHALITSTSGSRGVKHLEEYDLLEGEQRGAKPRCSGTRGNLLVDRMVCHDSRNSRKKVSMAWIDVRKAFDNVSHEWLLEMMFLHKFHHGCVIQ